MKKIKLETTNEIIILKMSLSGIKGLLLLFSNTQIFGEDCLWSLKLRLFFPTDQKVVANLMNDASVSANMEKVTLLSILIPWLHLMGTKGWGKNL